MQRLQSEAQRYIATERDFILNKDILDVIQMNFSFYTDLRIVPDEK